MTEERREENLPGREPAEGGDEQVQAPGADKGDGGGDRKESGRGKERDRHAEKERDGDYDI